MSHFQSLSAPFVDKPSTSDGSSHTNHYLQNNPALLHHLISPGGRTKIAPLKFQRKEKEEVSFEEGRRRALAATELALASPRTKTKFLEQELNWEPVDIGSNQQDRPPTRQDYQDDKRSYSSQGIASPVESESSQASYSSSIDPVLSEHSPGGPEYTVRPVDSRGSLSTLASDSSYTSVTRSASGNQRAVNGTPQQRLNQLRSVPHSDRGSAMASESALHPSAPRASGPRSSSIDTAITSLINQNEKGERSPEEIEALIHTAGSAEALIAHLLKDKAQAASQNAQLWRLVDKQRSMILSLNRDLEKAMKDKERYRKKLKEQLNAVPPLPTGDVARTVASPTPSDAHDTDTMSQDGKSSIKGLKRSDTTSTLGDEPIAPYPITPPNGASHMSSLAEEVMPDPEHHRADRSGQRIPPKLDLSKSTNETSAPTPAFPTPGMSTRGKRAPAPLNLQQPAQGFAVQREEPVIPGPTDLTEDQAREVLRQQEALISPGLPKQMSLGPMDNIKSTTLTAPGAGLSAKRGVNLPSASLKSPALGIGLPLSPRPIDRPLASPMFSPRQPRTEGRLGGPLSPPLSPRGFAGLPQSPRGGFTNLGGPLSPGILSPSLNGAFLTQMMQKPVGNIHEQLMAPLPNLSSLSKEIKQEEKAPGDFAKEPNNLNGVGLGGDEKLLVVPPALQTIDAKILATRVKNKTPDLSNRREHIYFTLAVYSRTNGNELWRIEKDVNTLGVLDSRMRQFANPKTFEARLPNMTLFTNHAPANVEGRKGAIEEYFTTVLGTIPLDHRAAQALCEYLSADVIDSTSPPGGSDQKPSKTKEGYLTKRGKNFGGWKSRYFVLDDGPVLRYFEMKGGAHLGSIRLPNAQIGKQSNSPPKSDHPEENDNQYRHAFLILEPKRKDSSSVVRHVLCAESDAERDEWVDCLMQYIDYAEDHDDSTSVSSDRRKQSMADDEYPPPKPHNPDLRAVGYDSMVAGQAPIQGPPTIDRRKETPSPSISTISRASDDKNVMTGLASTLGGKFMTNVASDASERQKPKKKGIWGFGRKASSEPVGQDTFAPTRLPPSRSVFGAHLADAVEISRPIHVDLAIPAVVYRSIEFLHARHAHLEEGIFRLSGSNNAIKILRERFNSQSDVDLLNDEELHDVHAVAGLLKLYLRELPSNVLTRDLHRDFVQVLEDHDKFARVSRLNTLVHQLPIENFTLLRLLSSHLITIVESADLNKMTIKNVGIVFSPTLNIPAGVFSLFILEYSSIFIRPGEEGYEEASLDNSTTDSQGNTFTTHLMAPPPPQASSVGLPSTPRRMVFDSPFQTEEKRQQNTEDFRALMEKTRHEERVSTPTAASFSSGGGLGGSMSLSVPTEKKKKRESTMLGLFSSSKLAGLKGKHANHEESPNPFDENSMYDV